MTKQRVKKAKNIIPLPVRIPESSGILKVPTAVKVTTFFARAIQLIIVIAVFAACFYLGTRLWPIQLPGFDLSGFEIIFISLSLAFTWVEIMKWGVTKPFNCLKCMTGWIALIIGCMSIGWHGIIYLPIGLFTGALFSAIKMRYL